MFFGFVVGCVCCFVFLGWWVWFGWFYMLWFFVVVVGWVLVGVSSVWVVFGLVLWFFVGFLGACLVLGWPLGFFVVFWLVWCGFFFFLFVFGWLFWFFRLGGLVSLLFYGVFLLFVVCVSFVCALFVFVCWGSPWCFCFWWVCVWFFCVCFFVPYPLFGLPTRSGAPVGSGCLTFSVLGGFASCV